MGTGETDQGGRSGGAAPTRRTNPFRLAQYFQDPKFPIQADIHDYLFSGISLTEKLNNLNFEKHMLSDHSYNVHASKMQNLKTVQKTVTSLTPLGSLACGYYFEMFFRCYI